MRVVTSPTTIPASSLPSSLSMTSLNNLGPGSEQHPNKNMRHSASAPNLSALSSSREIFGGKVTQQTKPIIEPGVVDSNDTPINLANAKLPPFLPQGIIQKISQPIVEQVLSGDPIAGTTSTGVDVEIPHGPKINIVTTSGSQLKSNSVTILPLALPVLKGGVTASMTQSQTKTGELTTSAEFGALFGIQLPNQTDNLNWSVGINIDEKVIKPYIRAELSSNGQMVALRVNLNKKLEPINSVVTLSRTEAKTPQTEAAQVAGETTQNIDIEIPPELLQQEIGAIFKGRFDSLSNILPFTNVQEKDDSAAS